MNYVEIKNAIGFYENELFNKFLPYWLPKCVDKENGGFFAGFEDSTGKLVSRMKYTWSQGRLTWLFAKLAEMESPILTEKQRKEYLALAKHGADFIIKYCIYDKERWHCAFLLDEFGNPQVSEEYNRADYGINADIFAILALSRYAKVSGDREVYEAAKKLYYTVIERRKNGDANGYPYPVPKGYVGHSRVMELTNIAPEFYRAAKVFEPELCDGLKETCRAALEDLFTNFIDENGYLHELITDQNTFFPLVMGNHFNPGHMTEEMWFVMDASEILETDEWNEKIYKSVMSAVTTGWDQRYGGLVHYAGINGGEPSGDNTGWENEPMYKQLIDWDYKLWWVHTESLYSLLRCYLQNGDERFKEWYEKMFEYTFRTFPNPNPEVGEWINIRDGEGKPINAVTSLPVKDPYHAMRNFVLIIELLYRELEKTCTK